MREREIKVLQTEAYQYLRERILDGTLQFNQIYSESKMAQDIGISRTPMRDAVHRLFQEGLIDIIPNKGFVLHKLDRQDVMETYEVRSAIEGYCARKMGLDSHTETVEVCIKELRKSIVLQEEIFSGDANVNRFAEEDQRFHLLLVSHSGNEAFTDIFSQYMYKIKKLACYSLSKEGRMEQTIREHRLILQAISDGDGQAAYEATLLHIQAPLDFNLESIYASDQC